MEGIDVIDVLLALVHLTFDPMSIQVAKQMVVVVRAFGVSIPLGDVEGDKGFIDMSRGILADFGEVVLEVLDKVVVEIFAEEMCYTMSVSSHHKRHFRLTSTAILR